LLSVSKINIKRETRKEFSAVEEGESLKNEGKE